jgi:cyanophycin synthetase
LPEPNTCFQDSRRLTGHNRFFAGTAAILETLGPTAQDAAAHARWRVAVTALCRALGWADARAVVKPHASGTLLVIAAPVDALFTATEVNEWAWEQASGIFSGDENKKPHPPFDQLHPLGDDFAQVVAAFAARAAIEKNPAVSALRAAARTNGVPIFVDDDTISLGAGSGSRTWPSTTLPDVATVTWTALHDIPTALVTGSNGKTTTVRLLAAIIDASDEKFQGKVGYSSTEGVMIGSMPAGEGDFAGPAGARVVLRDMRVEAAVLETARGGILRRGLAVDRADVAVVTNISADHFGEYGIDTLDDLADVKLAVAHALGRDGTLVLNADDPVLLARSSRQICRVALFAFDDAHPALAAYREIGGTTCGLIDGQLWLTHCGVRISLGEIRNMPLTLNGAAMFNVANIAAAALAAIALGVAPEKIADVLARFGTTRHDNPGRLDRWMFADITVLIDYAHNPGGLATILAGAESIRAQQARKSGIAGRIGLLLGQAGNRSDEAIADLARVAAVAAPATIVIKEIANMLRGRALGEVPALLKNALLTVGYPPENIHLEADEVEAACVLLRWARAGDVLVLPVHQTTARNMLSALLDRMSAEGWRAGSSIPGILNVDVSAAVDAG